jgi:hypothetical protein
MQEAFYILFHRLKYYFAGKIDYFHSLATVLIFILSISCFSASSWMSEEIISWNLSNLK